MLLSLSQHTLQHSIPPCPAETTSQCSPAPVLFTGGRAGLATLENVPAVSLTVDLTGCSVAPTCFLSVDGDQMVFDLPRPPHFRLSSSQTISGSKYAGRKLAGGVLPSRGAYPHPPGWRTCHPAQRMRRMNPDKAGHTHSIPSSLGRSLSKSRWKSLRTLNSPNSFSESSTLSQLQQISLFRLVIT